MQNYYMCGVYLNRGRVILFICFIPMAILLSQVEHIFIAIQMDRQTAFYAGQYVTFVIPGLFFHLNYDAVKSYLNGIGVTYVPMVIMFCTMLLHNLWCYILVDVVEMGVRGASIATMLTYFLNFFLSLVYVQILRSKNEVIKESWHFFDAESFKELWPYFKRAVNCCFLLILEWWCFEVVHLAST